MANVNVCTSNYVLMANVNLVSFLTFYYLVCSIVPKKSSLDFFFQRKKLYIDI
jgi:hypothetical protein